VTEQDLQQQIRLQLGIGHIRLWRNNCGVLPDRQGRPVRFGLCPGSSDLIGLRTVTVTPEMVGQRLAVFAAVEVKAPRGKLTEQQGHFLAAVERMGGLAGVARSVEDAAAILNPDHGVA
jgi:hypothetical protein